MSGYIAAWLLVYSWVDCGSGWSCVRFEQSVPSIATEQDCIALGKNVTADKRDRPSFRCISYAGADSTAKTELRSEGYVHFTVPIVTVGCGILEPFGNGPAWCDAR